MNQSLDFIKENFYKDISDDKLDIKNFKNYINRGIDINGFNSKCNPIIFDIVKNNNIYVISYALNYIKNINILDSKGCNILFYIILKGTSSIQLIKTVVDMGININQVNKNSRNIIDEILYLIDIQRKKIKVKEYPEINKHVDYIGLLKFFIKNEFNFKNSDFNIKKTLKNEIKNKNTGYLDYLIEAGLKVDYKFQYKRSLFHSEVLKGYSNIKMIEYFFKKGANVNDIDTNNRSIIENIIEIIFIQKNKKTSNPTFEPLVNYNDDYLSLLKKILEYKPNFNSRRNDGKNIIFDLILNNELELLEIFQSYDVNLNPKDNYGKTPLMYLIQEGCKINSRSEKMDFVKNLEKLLDFNLDVNVQDLFGRTVLHNAVIADNLTVVKKLLSKHPDLSIKDKDGRTPLHHTLWKGNYKIAKWLIISGANVDELDKSGFNILNYAAISANLELVITLLNSGALINNNAPKNRKVVIFFKNKEKNLEKLISSDIKDSELKVNILEVVQNLKQEINDALRIWK